MTSEKSCANCNHWIGAECHGMPPFVGPEGRAVWPVTKADDYCAKYSRRGRMPGKRSKAPDGAILRLILDEEELGDNAGITTKKDLVWNIKKNFRLSRTAAISRVEVMVRQGLLTLKNGIIRVARPELADPDDPVAKAELTAAIEKAKALKAEREAAELAAGGAPKKEEQERRPKDAPTPEARFAAAWGGATDKARKELMAAIDEVGPDFAEVNKKLGWSRLDTDWKCTGLGQEFIDWVVRTYGEVDAV